MSHEITPRRPHDRSAPIAPVGARYQAIPVPSTAPASRGYGRPADYQYTAALEVTGAELTLSPIHRAALGRIRAGAGLALRFPRFTGRWRDDKGPTEATTADELVRLYRTQVRQASANESGEESASSAS